MMLTSIAIMANGGGLAADVPPTGDTVCYTGFVMDTFCIERGTLLDNPSARALQDGEGPQLHSYHCLLDVGQCIDSGYELLEPPLGGSSTYCRVLKLDAAGNTMLLDTLRPMGRPGPGACTTCTGTEGDEVQGPRATVYGVVSDTGSPPTIAVTAVRPGSEPCNTCERGSSEHMHAPYLPKAPQSQLHRRAPNPVCNTGRSTSPPCRHEIVPQPSCCRSCACMARSCSPLGVLCCRWVWPSRSRAATVIRSGSAFTIAARFWAWLWLSLVGSSRSATSLSSRREARRRPSRTLAWGKCKALAG